MDTIDQGTDTPATAHTATAHTPEEIRERAIDRLAAYLWGLECNRPWGYDGAYAADLRGLRGSCLGRAGSLVDELEYAGIVLAMREADLDD